LAKVLKRGGNFLILDEPTNDLDLPTLRVLEEALETFPGCVLVVSHDRYFLNRVCTGILAFEGEGRVVYSEGNYDYYLEKKKRAANANSKVSEPTPKPSKSQPAAAPVVATPVAKGRKLTFKEQQEWAGIEAAIQVAEENVIRLENRLASPEFAKAQGGAIKETVQELELARAEASRLFSRWETLDALRAAAG
jgi:ATP-binding cassette subfamily F protein uup